MHWPNVSSSITATQPASAPAKHGFDQRHHVKRPRQRQAQQRTNSLSQCILNGKLKITTLRRLRPPAQRGHTHPTLTHSQENEATRDVVAVYSCSTFINCAEQNDASPPQCSCMHLRANSNNQQRHNILRVHSTALHRENVSPLEAFKTPPRNSAHCT